MCKGSQRRAEGTYKPEGICKGTRATPMVNIAHHLVHGLSKDEGGDGLQRKRGTRGRLSGGIKCKSAKMEPLRQSRVDNALHKAALHAMALRG